MPLAQFPKADAPSTRAPARRHSAALSGGPTSDSRDHLRGEARLIFPTGHGSRSAIVRYYQTGDLVTIRIPEFSDVANYLNGAAVTLEPRANGSTTAITGVAAIVDDAASPAGAAAALESWPAGIAARFVVINPRASST